MFLDSVVTHLSAAHLQVSSGQPQRAGILCELQALLQQASADLSAECSPYAASRSRFIRSRFYSVFIFFLQIDCLAFPGPQGKIEDCFLKFVGIERIPACTGVYAYAWKLMRT